MPLEPSREPESIIASALSAAAPPPAAAAASAEATAAAPPDAGAAVAPFGGRVAVAVRRVTCETTAGGGSCDIL